MTTTSSAILERPDTLVKPTPLPSSRSSPDTVIHHKAPGNLRNKILLTYSMYGEKRYAVSPARRVFSPQAILKRLDVIRTGLETRIGLTPRQAEAAIRLLKLWAYYGEVYPKASQITGEPELSPAMLQWRDEQGLGPPPTNDGVSRATFWRTIKILEGLGLIKVVSRYVVREQAQISNLYRLDQLVIALARYISERREFNFPDFMRVILDINDRDFWSFLGREANERAGPALPMFDGLLAPALAAA